MIRLPAQHAFDRGLPGRQIEPGKAVDEICADIGEARGTGGVEGFARLRRGVEPIERGQDAVVEALNSEADPRDASMPVAGEPLDADGFGIALHGDLGGRLEGKVRAQTVQDRRHRFGGQQGGRAAAQEDALEMDRGRPRRRRGQADLAEEGGHEARDRAGRVRRGVEGAVTAPLSTERDMQVRAQRVRARLPRGKQAHSRSRTGGSKGSRCEAAPRTSS